MLHFVVHYLMDIIVLYLNVLYYNQIFILRGEKVYTVQGQEVR